jgi:hypothetical protein
VLSAIPDSGFEVADTSLSDFVQVIVRDKSNRSNAQRDESFAVAMGAVRQGFPAGVAFVASIVSANEAMLQGVQAGLDTSIRETAKASRGIDYILLVGIRFPMPTGLPLTGDAEPHGAGDLPPSNANLFHGKVEAQVAELLVLVVSLGFREVQIGAAMFGQVEVLVGSLEWRVGVEVNLLGMRWRFDQLQGNDFIEHRCVALVVIRNCG